jgi:N-acyl-D-amino-acid deacylase
MRHRASRLCAALALASLPAAATPLAAPDYALVFRNGVVYDGSGGAPFPGDVAMRDGSIVAVGPDLPGRGAREVDVHGQAIAPGFVNMLAHPEESLLVDGRAQSDLRQGVTLEVLGEDSMGPVRADMKPLFESRQGDIKYRIDWDTLGGYFERLEKQGISINVASYVGAATVRVHVLGESDVAPTPEQLAQMRALVRQAMEEGALGLTTALIYAPNTYAKTPELVGLAQESARCGGLYSAHMRSEGDRLLPAIQEAIDIAAASGAPAHIYHFKQAGRDNWGKFDAAVALVEQARGKGTRISADMYLYTAGATGLDASMPPWVQDGGLEKWIERLRDPATRTKVRAQLDDAHPADWENFYAGAGPEGIRFLAFKNPALKKYTGRTLADVAAERGTSPQDTAMDLVVEDGSRVGTAYFLMDEANVRRGLALPWMGFDSDASAPSLDVPVFAQSSYHPRTFGNFARLLGKYVREEKLIPLPEAIRRLTSYPAQVLSLSGRGYLRPGQAADVVVFDPATIQDHASFDNPTQYATGVSFVAVNGELALENGEPTAARPGRVVRGRAWTGKPGGGCRAAAADWAWESAAP